MEILIFDTHWLLSALISPYKFTQCTPAPPPPPPQPHKQPKKSKAGRYHHFTYVYQELWSDGVWFLRCGVRDRQMDGWTDRRMDKWKMKNPQKNPPLWWVPRVKNSKRKTGEVEIYCKSLGNLILKSSGIITGFPMNSKPLSLKSWKNTDIYRPLILFLIDQSKAQYTFRLS